MVRLIYWPNPLSDPKNEVKYYKMDSNGLTGTVKETYMKDGKISLYRDSSGSLYYCISSMVVRQIE